MRGALAPGGLGVLGPLAFLVSVPGALVPLWPGLLGAKRRRLGSGKEDAQKPEYKSKCRSRAATSRLGAGLRARDFVVVRVARAFIETIAPPAE